MLLPVGLIDLVEMMRDKQSSTVLVVICTEGVFDCSESSRFASRDLSGVSWHVQFLSSAERSPSPGRRPLRQASGCGLSRLPSNVLVYARHGRDCCGVEVPCTSLGTFSRRTVYQMIALRGEVRDEGNCVRVTGGGKEVCDRVRKRRVCCSPPGRDHVKAAQPIKGVSSRSKGSGLFDTSERRFEVDASTGSPFRIG